MLLRAYRESDAAALCALFFDTVHTVCAKDYTEQQCDAWAPREFDCAALCGRLARSYALVAECGGVLAGFANLGQEGYFDCLYVSARMQRRGVATALADAMERRAAQQGASRMVSDVSIILRVLPHSRQSPARLLLRSAFRRWEAGGRGAQRHGLER